MADAFEDVFGKPNRTAFDDIFGAPKGNPDFIDGPAIVRDSPSSQAVRDLGDPEALRRRRQVQDEDEKRAAREARNDERRSVKARRQNTDRLAAGGAGFADIAKDDEAETTARMAGQRSNYQSFGKALLAGIDDLQMLTYSAGEAVGEVSGNETLDKWGERGRVRNTAQAAEKGERGQFRDIQTLGDALGWVAQTSGNMIPVMGPAIVGSTAAGLAAPAIGVSATVGGALGAFVPSLAMGVGETQANAKQKDPDADANAWTFVGGSAIGALDSALPGHLGGKLVSKFGREAAEEIAIRALSRPRAALREGVRDSLIEGGTESVQEAIGEVTASLAAKKDINWDALPGQMIESGMAGALMGAGSGGVTGGVTGGQARATEAPADPFADMFGPDAADPEGPTTPIVPPAPPPEDGIRRDVAGRPAGDPIPGKEYSVGDLVQEHGYTTEEAENYLTTGEKARPHVPLKQSDRDSVIPDDVIQGGKDFLADALADMPGVDAEAIMPEAAPRVRPRPIVSVPKQTASLPGDVVAGLVRRGIPEHVARGAAAGTVAESSNDHTIVNPTSGALGLGQWLGPRKAELIKRYGANPTREQQIDFLAWELKGGDFGGKDVLAAKDEASALHAYITKFMRPKAGAETTGDLERGMAALGGGTIMGTDADAAVDTFNRDPRDMPEPESTADTLKRLTGEDIFSKGDPVEITQAGVTRTGTVEEAYGEGEAHGIRVKQDDGSYFDEVVQDARRYGATIERPARAAGVTVSEPQAPSKVRVAPPSLRASERSDTAVTSAGRSVPVRYALIEAADLVASNTPEGARNPDYPANLQPRDRTRGVSQAQVNDIAANLDPRLLGPSPKASDGAPIISPEGVVESGNGRTLAIRQVYQQGKGQPYRDFIEGEGFDTSGMTEPVLVRVRGDMADADVEAFTREANARDTLGFSATEQAMSDAAATPDDLIDLYRGGDIDSAANRDFVRSFLKRVVSQNDYASMVAADGTISQGAVQRVRSAMLARAYGDSNLVAQVAESTDSNIKAIGGALTDVAGVWSKLVAGIKAGNVDPAMDITENVNEAVRLVDRARREGVTVADLVGQRDIFSGEGVSERTEQVLRLLFATPKFTKPTSRKSIVDALAYYADQATKAAPGGGLFAGTQATPEALLDRAKGKQSGETPGQQGSIFDAPAGDNGGSVQGTSRADGRPGGEGLQADNGGETAGDVAPAAPAELSADPGGALKARLKGDRDRLFDEYDALPDANGGVMLSADTARELSPEYMADRTRTGEVHEAASAIIKAIYKDKLSRPTLPGHDPMVLFTGGGTGAGKTTAVDGLTAATGRNPEIVYDTNLQRLDSAVKKIDQALEAGRDVSVMFVYRDPVEALRNGAIPRAQRQEREFGTGRTVPLQAHLATHLGSRKVVEQLREHYATESRVKIEAFDNSRGKGEGRMVPIDNLPPTPDIDLLGALRNELDAARQRGLSESLYQGFLAKYETEEDGGLQPPSRPRQGDEDNGRRDQRGGTEEQVAPEPAPAQPAGYGAKNKVITPEKYADIRAKLAAKLSGAQLNSGVDPEILALGTQAAMFHLEAGARKFVDFTKAVSEDLGQSLTALKPYLRAWYLGGQLALEDSGEDVSGMDGPGAVRAAVAMIPDAVDTSVTNPVDDIGTSDADAPTEAPGVDDRPSDEGPSAADAPGIAGERPATEGIGEPGSDGEGQLPAGERPSDSGNEQGVTEPDAPGSGAGVDAGAKPSSGSGNRPSNRLRAKPAGRGGGRNYLAPKGSLRREGSWRATAERNLDIIELVNKLEAEGRAATLEEQKLLAKFTGWGASEIANGLFRPHYKTNELSIEGEGAEARLKPAWAGSDWGATINRARDLLKGTDLETAVRSTQYAHYTSEAVIRSIWSGIEKMGFAGGKILEPGMGNALFALAAPKSVMEASRYTGIELDPFTAKIAAHLLPQENATQGDFIKQRYPDGFFDLAIGNPPFSSMKVRDDPAYKKQAFALHNYFAAKSIDKVRPGGLMVLVSSRNAMDNLSPAARQYIADRADLLGAVRLPQTAFKDNAGAEVVTDVMFFQRRAPGVEAGGAAWLKSVPIKVGDDKIPINEYFKANPKMVLGTHATTGSMYRANEYTVEPFEGDIEKQFAKAIARLPSDIYTAAVEHGTDELKAKAYERDFAPASEKEGGLYASDKGLFVRDQGSGVDVRALFPKFTTDDVAWLKDYVPLRDALKQAQKDQLQGGDWEASLAALNKEYDKFTKKHGNVKAFKVIERKDTNEDGEEIVTASKRWLNHKRFEADTESPLVMSLERITDDDKIVKGPFLLGRTLNKPVRPVINSVQDALFVTLDEIGKLDLPYVAKLAGITQEKVLEELGDGVFMSPSGGWQTADEYLSGDVVAKLEEAKAAAENEEAFERNVTALQAVQPRPLGADKVDLRLGAGWVPVRVVREFAAQEIGLEASTLEYEPTTAEWAMEGKGSRRARGDVNEYGTDDRSAQEIFLSVLNNQSLKVIVKDSKKLTMPKESAEATAAATNKANLMLARFRTWAWEDAARAGDLLEIYNRQFNNLAPRKFDGSHLTLPGLSSKWTLHPHVKRAVWRIIQSGNTYLNHAVGAGKTLEMIVSGMEQKRLGLIKKPMYVVPNHMLNQFSSEFLDAYPAAKIMVADEAAFHTDNRKRFMAHAALNDPDAIIITHSSFGKLNTNEQSRQMVIGEMIAELKAALVDTDNRFTVKKLQKQIEALERSFNAKMGEGRDQALTFEEMGVDMVYIDEAHEFRKLDYATNRQVKGVDPVGSQRALDLYVKTRWLEKQRPGRSIVMASGTPVTNTMAELYTVMRYMNEEGLKRDGLRAFDAWANMFGEVKSAPEQDAAGGFSIVDRFAAFVNVPELMKRVREFMDVLTSEQLGDLVKRPLLKGGAPEQVITRAVPALDRYMKGTLAERIKATKKWKPSRDQPNNPDPIIAINGDALLASIDMRFIDPALPNDPDSKLNKMIDNIIAGHRQYKDLEYFAPNGSKEPIKGGAQIVFSPVGFGEQAMSNRGFNLREWMDTRLMKEGGLKRSEIAWMSDADSHAKKDQLQKDVRSGKVKILVGSPKNMGTGLNVQNRLKALHFLSPPWYPSDVTQPMGRAERQGNQNEEIDAQWYSVKDSYDSTAWGMVARKARFIEQAYSGDESVRRIEDFSAPNPFALAEAMSAGDDRVMKIVTLDAEIDNLTNLQNAHADEQKRFASDKRSYEKYELPRLTKEVKALEAGMKERDIHAPFSAELGGARYTKQKEAGEALLAAIQKQAMTWRVESGQEHRLGTLQGKHPILMVRDDRHGSSEYRVMVRVGPAMMEAVGWADLTTDISDMDPTGVATRINNAAGRVASEFYSAQAELKQAEETYAKLNKRLGAPFPRASELTEKVAERDEIKREIAAEAKANDEAAARERGETTSEPQASVGGGEDIDVTPEDAAAIRDALLARLAELNIADRISLEAAKGLKLERDGQGQYYRKLISINLSRARDPMEVLHHEAVHATRALNLYADAEWRALTARAERDGFMDWAKENYPRLATFEQEEEAIAQLSAVWATRDRAVNGWGLVGRAFQRVSDFIKALSDVVVRDASGLPVRAQNVLRAWTRGEIGARETGKGFSAAAKASVAGTITPGSPAFQNPDSEARWQDARKGVGNGPGLLTNMKDWWGEIKDSFTRHWRNLPNEPRFADVGQQLRKLEAAPDAAMESSVKYLKQLVEGLSPAEYDLLSRKIVLDDLTWESGIGHQLPFGFTPSAVVAERQNIDAMVALNPKLIAAMRLRKKHNRDVVEDAVDAGVLTEEQVKNPAYFRHMVLLYARAETEHATTGGKKVKAPYWARRKGSALDINANLLEAELDWLQKVKIDTATAKTIEWVKTSSHNTRKQLQDLGRAAKAAGEKVDINNLEDLVKRFGDGTVAAWQPRKGRHMFTAMTVGETAVDMIADKVGRLAYPGVSQEELEWAASQMEQALVQGGHRYAMVLPKELATTLEEFGDRHSEGVAINLYLGALSGWKRWVLINPRRFLKYNINNMSGDLDAIIAGNAGTLTKVGEAWKILRAGTGARYQEALDRGVFTAGLSVQEIPDINRLSEFRRLSDDKGRTRLLVTPVAKVWQALSGVTQFRENLFRMAAYLDYIEKIESGMDPLKIGYGASVPNMVDAVKDPKDRAALLARDLVGDYGNISTSGSFLRRFFIPFWSWTEINTRRYYRLTHNAFAVSNTRGLVTGGLLGAGIAGRTAAFAIIRMGMVYALLNIANRLFHPDEEDDLTELQKRQVHLILGRDSKGEVISLRTQGALSDVLGTFGFTDAMAGIKNYEDGQGSIGDIAKAMAKAPVNKVLTGTNPMWTVPIEQLRGQTSWPDFFSGRPIHDRFRHIAGVFSVENEYDATLDALAPTGLAYAKPSRGYARSWTESVVYKRDPGEMAYDDAKGIAYDWLSREKGQGGGGNMTNPRSEALRDYRLALRYNDEPAAMDALDRYEAEGGTDKGFKASQKRQHPLGPIAKKDRADFLASLTDEQLETFEDAEEFYWRVYVGKQP